MKLRIFSQEPASLMHTKESLTLMDIRLFQNRQEAGQELANRLLPFWGTETAVLALPRGGVAIGYEIAQKLKLPLDTVAVAKLSSQKNPEFALGAIAPPDIQIIDQIAVKNQGIPEKTLEVIILKAQTELERRAEAYRSGAFTQSRHFDSIIIADDGIATGSTMKAAIASVRRLHPTANIIVAVPVADEETTRELSKLAARMEIIEKPEHMVAIGLWYQDFPQLSDEEVVDWLERANKTMFSSET